MVTQEELSFFIKCKTSEELFEKFGYKSGTDILKEVLEEGFVDSRNNKLCLTKIGKNKLNQFKKIESKKQKNYLLQHPLLLVIISVVLTAFLTFVITAHFMNLENELSVRFIGENKIITPPNNTIAFNGITIYNPTSKKVSINNVYVERSSDWIKNQYREDINKTTQGQENITYVIPEIVNNYSPYMILESGETKLMNGQFNLKVPNKEGIYELNFYVETLDGKKYYVDRKMIIEVEEK